MTKQAKKSEAVQIAHDAPVYEAAHTWADNWIQSQQRIADAQAAAEQSEATSLKDFAESFATLYADNTKAYRKSVVKGLRASGVFDGVSKSATDTICSRIQQFANLTAKQRTAASKAKNFASTLAKFVKASKPAKPEAEGGDSDADDSEGQEVVETPTTPDGYVAAILALAEDMGKLNLGKDYMEWCQAVEMGARILLKGAVIDRKLRAVA